MTARAPHEGWLLAGLAVIGVALPLAVCGLAGTFDVPYSDEFTFRRTALGFHETGELRLGGWSIMTFVGQLLAIQPLLTLGGGATWAFPVTAGAFAFLAITAGYALARRFLPPGASAVAVLMVLAFPGLLVEVPTFMTDIPAFALELLCLALGARALEGRGRWIERPRLLALSLLAGVGAFSIREFGLAAPVAVLVAGSVAAWAGANGQDRRAGVRRISLAWTATLGACLGIYLVTSGLPGQAPAQLHAPTPADVLLARQAVATTAFAISPALVVALGGWLGAWLGGERRWDRAIVLGAGLGLVAGFVVYAPELWTSLDGGLPAVLVGNVLSAAGSTGSGTSAGIRPVLFGPPTWKLLNVLALVAVLAAMALAGGLMGRAISGVRRHGPAPMLMWLSGPTGLLVIFSGLYLAGTLAFGLVGSLYDRYLWPLILPLAIPLLARALGGRSTAVPPPASSAWRNPLWFAARGLAAVILGSFAASSLALLLNRAAFDVGRWDAGLALVAAGYPAGRVDAGYEWVGDHAAEIVIPDRGPTPEERWYHLMVRDYQPCAIVASSPLAERGIELASVTREAYRLLLFTGPAAPLYVYRTNAAGCP